MKIFDIAIKDLLHSLRTFAGIFFMFVLPLLTTAILHFAFGGFGDGEGNVIPVTEVVIVNLDQAPPNFGGFSIGGLITEVLGNEELDQLIHTQAAESETQARLAVDNQEAGVAVIIPPGFTEAAFMEAEEISITIYQDPTLTIGSAIVRNLLSQIVDGFSGSIIATNLTAEQLATRGGQISAAVMQQVAAEYVVWTENLRANDNNQNPVIQYEVVTPEELQTGFSTRILSGVMAGMLIFYAFFTGASVAQTIIQEDEAGTLARLFTTPTTHQTILGGKIIAVFLTLTVQVLSLLALSTLIFQLQWGDFVPMALSVLGLIAGAGGFGILLMSFIKTTQQAGPVMGGVITMTGMAGGLMTTGFENLPDAFRTAQLFTPQGWALRTWETALDGGTALETLWPALGCLAIGAIMFLIGVRLFRRRFS